MLIDHINLNQLRIFTVVFHTRSMTTAAKELHLTQSGISQHIKALEEVLGVTLFDRVKQRLVPTAAARHLAKSCISGLNGLENALSSIKEGGEKFAGTVSIGMPIEFGNNVIMPLIARLSKKHPLVTFHFTLGFAPEMNEKILKGEMDFAFIDDFAVDKSITTEKIYNEVIELCASPEILKDKGPIRHEKKFYEKLNYVCYQDDEPILKMWVAHHLGIRSMKFKTKATVMDVQGIARLVLKGVGAGALPDHLIHNLKKEGQKVHIFKGCGKPLKNQIRIAYLKDRSFTPAAAGVMALLKEELLK